VSRSDTRGCLVRQASPPAGEDVEPVSPGDSTGDEFGVRIAGLAACGLNRLRCERSWALAEELATLTVWLAAEGEALSEVLYELIRRGDRPDTKPALVGLRRAVYTGRRPDHRELRLDAVPPPVAARIEQWLNRLQRRKQLDGQLPDVLTGELAATAAALRELATDPGFRTGLAHSSPALSAELDKWITDPGALPRRQVLARLARYTARVMTKTSPYSTFTISGLGRWTDSGAAVVSRAGLHDVATVTELDLRLVWRLADAIIHRTDLRGAATIRVNPSLTEHNGHFWFLAAGPAEALSRVPAVPALRDVLATVIGQDAPALAAIRQATGSTALDRLTQIGVLEVRRPFADQTADPLGDLLAWTELTLSPDSPDRPWLPAHLRELHAAVTAGPRSETPAARLAQISATTARLLDRLTGENETPLQMCLDTAVSTTDLAVCGRDAWRPVLADLQVLRKLLGLFDSDLPVKLAAAQLFADKYSPQQTVSLLDFYRMTHSEESELRRLIHCEPAPTTARLHELQKLRDHAWLTLVGPAADPSGTVTVDPELARTVISSWPQYVHAPGSICCFGQALPGPGLVLNTVFSGYGRHTGRIRHLMARAGAKLASPGPYPVAEVTGSFGTGLNLRPKAAAAAIDYPFTVTTDGLRLADLRVGYDEATSRLTLLDPCGRRLLPAHLGMSSEVMLPPAWMFLIRVFGEPPVAFPLSWSPSRPSGHGREQVRREPRLALGTVVIARARWCLRAADFPTPGKGETDARYLVRAAQWLARHDIPRSFFARTTPPAGGPVRTKASKPLYIDAASYCLLTSFARSLQDPEGTVVLEETLPDPADAPCYGPGGRRVTEYVFEISGGPA
jgi:hypothetical protein